MEFPICLISVPFVISILIWHVSFLDAPKTKINQLRCCFSTPTPGHHRLWRSYRRPLPSGEDVKYWWMVNAIAFLSLPWKGESNSWEPPIWLGTPVKVEKTSPWIFLQFLIFLGPRNKPTTKMTSRSPSGVRGRNQAHPNIESLAQLKLSDLER